MKLRAYAALLLAALQLTGTAAQARGQSEAEAALRIAADRIETDYIDPALARLVAARLRREAASLRRRPRQGEALAEELTGLVRALTSDEHFGFRYSAEAMPPGIFAPPTAAQAAAAAQRTARINNFGVLKAERLPGNIGLLDLDQFTDPALMRRPLAAAMDLLRNCDALIVDLRFNGGGHAGGAALAASYFLPERPQRLLARFETRHPGETLELRTEGRLESERFLDRPLFILTGPRTFSAAEFFTAVLRREGRATVVGTRTRGGAHPSQRVRLTAHYGMMLPTTRGNLRDGSNRESASITPDLPAEPGRALAAAQRVILAALISARPGDVLADRWRELLQAMPAESAATAQH